jgi:aminoglycoside phosphotransferase (APT) family kinase protein
VTAPAAGQPDGPPDPARQWAAEVLVTPDLAADLIRQQFPGLGAGQAAPLATGWDNTVYLVDDRWLFRFPRRAVALPGLGRELAVLPRLAPRLPLPVPVPELAGQPSPRYPWPFWGAALLPGRELADAALPEAGRTAAAVGLGRFLRALHDPALVPVADGAVPGGLPADPMRRGEPAGRARWAAEILARLRQRGLPDPGPAVTRLLTRAAGTPGPPPGAPGVVCHGDLHIRHLLVDEAGAAAGVIDWGDLCLADPSVDLSIAYAGFAGPDRAALLAAYGAVPDARREIAARVLAVFLSAALAEYALDDDRPVLLAEAVAGLRRAVAG